MAYHRIKVLIGPYTFPTPYNGSPYATGSIVTISQTAFDALPAGDFTGTAKIVEIFTLSDGGGGGGGGTTPDATTLVKGKVQLAGDLAGTASAPTVPGIGTHAAAPDPHPQYTPVADFDAHTDPANANPHPVYASDSDLVDHSSKTRPNAAHNAAGVSVDVAQLIGLTLESPDVMAALKALNTRSLPSDLGVKEKDFSLTGALAVGVSPGLYPAPPTPQAFLGARATCNVAPAGGDAVFTLRQDGSSSLHEMQADIRATSVRNDANGNVASYNIPSLGVPGDTTVKVGDLLLIIVTCQSNRYVPVPAGFTQVAVIATTSLADAGSKTYVFRKKADAIDAPAVGSGPSYTINLRDTDLVTAKAGRSTGRLISVKNPYTGPNDGGDWAVATAPTTQNDTAGTTSFPQLGATPTGPSHLFILVASANQGTAGATPTLSGPGDMTPVGTPGGGIMASQIVMSKALPDDSRATTGIKTVTANLGCKWTGVCLTLRPPRPTVRAGQRKGDFEVGPSTANILSGFIPGNALVSVEVDSIGDAGTTGSDATVTMRIKDAA
jgi:hypothetical protein